MIIYDVKHWVPTDINMLTIAGKNGDYYYIHRSLYDQAVVLDDKYHNNIPALIKAITGKEDSRDDVEYFLQNTPRPLNIFGPFLLLVNDLIEDYVDMVGAIHVMSGPVNLRQMIDTNPYCRNVPTFSLSVKEEYELAWNRFFQSVIPYSPDMYSGGGLAPMNGTQTVVMSSGEYDDADEMSDDEYDQAMWELLNPPADFLTPPADEPADSTTDSVETSEVKQPEPELVAGPNTVLEPTPEPEPEPEPEVVEEVPARLSGLAALTGGIL